MAHFVKPEKSVVQHSILADGISIHIGDNVWSFSLNFIVYLLIAAIVGFLAEFIVEWRLPLGFIGAIIFVAIWHLLTYRAWYLSRRYSYRRY